MDGFILDTTVLSAYLDASHRQHRAAQEALQELEQGSALYLSTISLAELDFGVHMAREFGGTPLPNLERMLVAARHYPTLGVSHHTAAAYAELKTNLAKTYLSKTSRRDRPRWVEEWKDKTTGRMLQIDENDLWICSQAKERLLTVATGDRRMKRISDADSEVRLHIM